MSKAGIKEAHTAGIRLFDYYKPHPRQVRAHNAKERHILFGGATAGGKSVWLVMDALWRSLCYSYNSIGLYRLLHSSFTRTTYQTMEEWLIQGLKYPQGPELIQSHNRTKHEIVLINGSKIAYGGLQSTNSVSGDALSIIRSLEHSSIYLDEVTDFTEKMYEFFGSRVYRKKVYDPQLKQWLVPPARIAATCNPSLGWVKSRFVDRRLPNHVFIPSTVADNTFLGPEYVESLMQSFTNPAELDQYINGNWDAVVDYACIFHPGWLTEAMARKTETNHPVVFGVDVAAMGDDLTVVVLRRGMKSEVIWTAKKQNTMQTAEQVAMLASRYKPDSIVIDSIGVGQGVFDRLNQLSQPVYAFIGGAKADDDRFLNKRTEEYWGLRILLEEGRAALPNHSEAINELGSIRYLISASDRTIQVESKQNIIKRLGHSPDYADAFVYAYAGAAWDRSRVYTF